MLLVRLKERVFRAVLSVGTLACKMQPMVIQFPTGPMDRLVRIRLRDEFSKAKKMSGQMGNAQVTTQNLEIVRVDAERNLLLIKGAVPGAPGGDIIVRPAVKA